ncbi:hypothetical protein ACVGV4_00080, partial [Enterobacter hormaechei]
VLALSLMGLVLGMWLRQSEGRGGPARRPPHRDLVFKQTYKCGVANPVTPVKQRQRLLDMARNHTHPPRHNLFKKN